MTQITRLYVENPYQKCLIFGFRVHIMGSLVKALVSSLVSLLGRVLVCLLLHALVSVKRSLVFSEILHEVWGQKRKEIDTAEILKQILIQ